MARSNVSIKDIARLSGFSISTVSRVLNNTGRFSQTTRNKIISIAKDYNYQKNAIAQGMRRGSLAIIGILVPDITNAYYATLVKKCEQYLFNLGYLAIVCNTDRNPELEKKYISQLGNHFVDGMIIISTQPEIDKSHTIPTVFIDRFPKITRNVIATSSDNFAGAALATNHLIDHSAYPIMITTKHNQFSSNQKRMEGFINASKNRGIKNPKIITLDTNSDSMNQTKPKLIEILRNLLKEHSKIGIFAVNDNVAVYTYQTAIENQIVVPNRLSIVGFDGSTLAKEVQLTTIKQDTDKIAKTSCDNLMKLLKNEEVFNRQIIIPVTLIKRRTT